MNNIEKYNLAHTLLITPVKKCLLGKAIGIKKKGNSNKNKITKTTLAYKVYTKRNARKRTLILLFIDFSCVANQQKIFLATIYIFKS